MAFRVLFFKTLDMLATSYLVEEIGLDGGVNGFENCGSPTVFEIDMGVGVSIEIFFYHM